MIYMSKNNIIVLILLAILFTGCGYKETNTQTRDISFLKFNKSMSKKYIVIVNETYKFNLDSCINKDGMGHCTDNADDKRYEIKSGNSVVEVLDNNNNLIMRKEMYIGSSNTMEINLP